LGIWYDDSVQVWRTNAWAEIHGAPQWLLQYLARHLSVEVELGADKGTRYSVIWKHHGRVYGSLVHGNRVSAGLTDHVLRLARHYGFRPELRDLRQRPEDQLPLWSVSMAPRPYQEGVHQAILRGDCGVIDAPPRSGKTLMAARALDTFALPSVYVAPSVQIVRQTYERMVEWFGEDMCARLDGSATPAQRDVSKPFVIATAPSVVKQSPEWWATRRVLIIDEFHHAAAETYHKISALAVNAYYRLGFTGTHFRTGDDGLAMEAVCSNVLYRIPVDYLVEHGFLAAPRVCFSVTGAPPVDASDWRAAYQKGIVDCDVRNGRVVEIASVLAANGIPTIVLVKRRAHADALGERILNSVVVKGGENALTSSRVHDFLEGRHEVLIGTSVIGEGVDVPRAAALIYASGGADGVAMMQSYFRPLTAHAGKSVGRIYDFIDTHNGTLRRHSERRQRMAVEQLGAGSVVF
jgi:superfamily II DNA or RNA helicase